MNSKKTPNTPRISIILVNWNGKKWLPKCLTSLSEQSYHHTEIIMVDNGSTDDSVSYTKKHFPKVHIILNASNTGFAAANSLGIKQSTGTHILLINTDTWVEKDFLKDLNEFYQTHTYDAIAPTERRYDRSADFPCNTTIDMTGSPAYYEPRYNKAKLFYLSGVCLFFSKKLYVESHGLDENFFMYFEETDWFWRLSLLKHSFAYAEDIFVYHAGAGSTGKGIQYNAFLWRNQNSLQMLLKNYQIPTLLFVVPLYLIQNVCEMVYFLLTAKPKIAWTYIEGWKFNITNIRRTVKARSWVQAHRLVPDSTIMKKMYVGSGKFLSLMTFFGKTKMVA